MISNRYKLRKSVILICGVELRIHRGSVGCRASSLALLLLLPPPLDRYVPLVMYLQIWVLLPLLRGGCTWPYLRAGTRGRHGGLTFLRGWLLVHPEEFLDEKEMLADAGGRMRLEDAQRRLVVEL